MGALVPCSAIIIELLFYMSSCYYTCIDSCLHRKDIHHYIICLSWSCHCVTCSLSRAGLRVPLVDYIAIIHEYWANNGLLCHLKEVCDNEYGRRE